MLFFVLKRYVYSSYALLEEGLQTTFLVQLMVKYTRGPSINTILGGIIVAWIKQIEENEAQGKLKELYNRITSRTKGRVANILKVHSLHPDALEAHLNLYETLMFGESGLSRAQREMIAVVVSSANSCKY